MTTHGNSYKVVTTGFHVCVTKPWLAASPDGLVEDPLSHQIDITAYLEIKFPYSARILKPSAACIDFVVPLSMEHPH